MIRVKNILCDLIDYAYPTSDKKEQYKKMFVEMSNKTMKSMHGRYCSKDHHIVIYNLYRADDAIVATTIHELAHHVDFCNRNTTDHKSEFYQVYAELLYAALDMKLFSIHGFLEATRDASDSNKVAMMISGYHPNDVGYKKDRVCISVFHCYEQREHLREIGYSYNGPNKTWEIEISQKDLENEENYLKNLNLKYKIESASNITFNVKQYIIATGDTYSYKDLLKSQGFIYVSKGKYWKKEGSQESYYELRQKLPYEIKLKLK